MADVAGSMNMPQALSVIIPTYNGARRISECLRALLAQETRREFEVLVVDDGSTDATAEVVAEFPRVRLIRQSNAGPAAARNRGAREASGEVILFTDDDCVPLPNWIESMVAPFEDPEVIGAKGTYRTRQTSLAARFVQVEYEDKYRVMQKFPSIDFIDTYSAAFQREKFLQLGGYDTSFPVACAEDVELSYRMSARGWKMVFAPSAVVYHTHPATVWSYLKKKYKFAYWRMLAVRKNPEKGVRDSHTPQLMKLQVLFAPVLVMAIIADVVLRTQILMSAVTAGLFFVTAIPFAARAAKADLRVGLLSPILLAARSVAQFLGVTAGVIHVWRTGVKQPIA